MSDETSGQPQKQRRKLTKAEKITMVVMVVVFIGIFGVLTHGNSSPAVQNTQNVQASSTGLKVGQPMTVNVPSDKPATPPQPQTLLDLSSSGTKQTQQFTVTGNWKITYTYDCSNYGYQGNFTYGIHDVATNSETADIGANDLGMSGGSTNYYYDTGTFYLSVISECNWHITVIQ